MKYTPIMTEKSVRNAMWRVIWIFNIWFTAYMIYMYYTYLHIIYKYINIYTIWIFGVQRIHIISPNTYWIESISDRKYMKHGKEYAI